MTRPTDRGAILIHVALAILVLTAMSAYAIDYGVLWYARAQAQNAADAGALAGANSLIQDDPIDHSATSVAAKSATALAQQNHVFGEVPGVHVDLDPAAAWDHPAPAKCGTSGACVQVDVYRDGSHNSTQLPVFFAALFNLAGQNMKATATAWAASANGTGCLRPWMIPDPWEEHTAPATAYNPAPLGADVYTPPIPGPGTGFRIPRDIGLEVTLKQGDPSGTMSASDYFVIDIDPDCTGGNCYRDSIINCVNIENIIGGTLRTEPGNMVGPTHQGVSDLIALDRSARWNGTRLVNDYGPDAGSPRVVPVAIFSPAEFAALDRSTGRFTLTIQNLIGFFVESESGGDVTGRLVSDAGDLIGGGPVPGPEAAFLHVVQLIR